ncbi:MAG: proline--tRNA ligase [Candidatus Aenigmatarchaeota archaeon]
MAKEEGVGLKYPKSNFSEWYNELLMKAELADLRYNAKGFLVHRPTAVLTMREMYKLYEAALERKGHQPVLFPAVIPEENFLKEAEHVKGFQPEVFWITVGEGKDKERLALRPTSETAMYRMYSLWIRSWRDLPLKLYQSVQVWRCDTKATRPFIRGREFYWLEAHDVFATKKESEDQVIEDMQTTEEVLHQEFGIPFIPFQRPEWDKFPGAVHTFAADCLMPDGKIIQQPSTHLLGQNFAKSFNVKFKDKNEKEQLAWQTCYGPAVWRMISSVIATHGDDQGLILPFKIAPIQVVLIPVVLDNQILKKCEQLEKNLRDKGLRVKTDTTDNRAGWKFNQWELKGVPIRLEIGNNEIREKKITLARRDMKDKIKIDEKKLYETIIKEGQKLSSNLLEKADKDFNSRIHSAKNMKELEEKLKGGGFVKISFCSIDSDGEKCAGKLQEKTHAHVRGRRIDIKEKAAGECLFCGKKAKEIVYVGKQY